MKIPRKIIEKVLRSHKVQVALRGKEIKGVVYIPNALINFVTEDKK